MLPPLPPADDTSSPALRGMWRFYRPRVGTVLRWLWEAGRLQSDLTSVMLVYGTVVAAALTLMANRSRTVATAMGVLTELLPWVAFGLLAVLLVYGFLRANYQRFVTREADVRATTEANAGRGVAERDTRMTIMSDDHERALTALRTAIRARDEQLASVESEREDLREQVRALVVQLDDRDRRHAIADRLGQFLVQGDPLTTRLDRKTLSAEYAAWEGVVLEFLKSNCTAADVACFTSPPVPPQHRRGTYANDEQWRHLDRVGGQMEILRSIMDSLR